MCQVDPHILQIRVWIERFTTSLSLQWRRTALNISTQPIYAPGDMNAMFANIPIQFSHYGAQVLSTSPWMIVFDHFITDEEANALISTNEGRWERSTDSGSVNE